MEKFLADLTINNPIFIFAVVTLIWFLPGLVIRRIAEKRYQVSKAEAQSKAIARLYPPKK